jgi:hypothetical protein
VIRVQVTFVQDGEGTGELVGLNIQKISMLPFVPAVIVKLTAAVPPPPMVDVVFP